MGHPNTSVLISHVLTVIGTASAREMVADLVAGRRLCRARFRLFAQAAIIATMIAAFTIAAPEREEPLFFEHYKDDPRLGLYWCIFIGSAVGQLICIANRTLRYTQHDDKWLGRGLRLIGYGSACVALFLASRMAEVAVPIIPRRTDPAGLAVLLAGGFLLATGVLLPQIGLLMDRARSRRRLYPLWETVTNGYPHVRVRSRRPSLYRCVIEVHDALAQARAQRKINTPALLALDGLGPRLPEDFDATVRDLLTISDKLE